MLRHNGLQHTHVWHVDCYHDVVVVHGAWPNIGAYQFNKCNAVKRNTPREKHAWLMGPFHNRAGQLAL